MAPDVPPLLLEEDVDHLIQTTVLCALRILTQLSQYLRQVFVPQAQSQ